MDQGLGLGVEDVIGLAPWGPGVFLCVLLLLLPLSACLSYPLLLPPPPLPPPPLPHPARLSALLLSRS